MSGHPRNIKVSLTEPEAVWLLTSGLVNWDKEEPTARSAHDRLRRAMEKAHQPCTCGPEEKCSACPTREDFAKVVTEMDAHIDEIMRLEHALRLIRDRPWVENVLDPQWPARVATAALPREVMGMGTARSPESVECPKCGAPALHPCNDDAEGIARSETHDERKAAVL